jgi:hypothetical protein
VEEGHDTPDSWAVPALDGAGAGWIVHDVPFQASVRIERGEPAADEKPTASQMLADAHETSSRLEKVAPAGGGTVSRLQTLPFQPSAKGA